MQKASLKLLGSISIVMTLAFGCATAKNAKVSRSDAEHTALNKVPGGTIKEGELEKEHGRLIWSFDIATPGTTTITEVHVDANTGEVEATERESEAHEKAEKAEKKK